MKYNIGDRITIKEIKNKIIVGLYFDEKKPCNSYYRVETTNTTHKKIKASSIEPDNPIYKKSLYKKLDISEFNDLIEKNKIILPIKIKHKYNKGDIIRGGFYKGYTIADFILDIDNYKHSTYTIYSSTAANTETIEVLYSFIDSEADIPDNDYTHNKFPTYTYDYLKEHKDIPIVEVTLWNKDTKEFQGLYYYANSAKHLLFEGSYALAPVKRPSKDKWWLPCKILNTNVNLEYAKDTILKSCDGKLDRLGFPINTIYGMN